MGSRQHEKRGATLATGADAPSSAEQAIVVLPQDGRAAVLIAVGSCVWLQLPDSAASLLRHVWRPPQLAKVRWKLMYHRCFPALAQSTPAPGCNNAKLL